MHSLFFHSPHQLTLTASPKGEVILCAHTRVDADIDPYELRKYVTTQNYYPSVTIFTPKKRAKTRFFGFFALKRIKYVKNSLQNCYNVI